MIQKWLGDLFDTLGFLFLLLGTLAFFIVYWKDSCRIRIAEMMADDFLEKVSVEGSFSLEDYEMLQQQIELLDVSYEVELSCQKRVTEPCYAFFSKEQIDRYYLERNVREQITLPEYKFAWGEEDVEKLCLQQETNDSILAAGEEQYLPLPKEEETFLIEAVRKVQRVYEGEELITLCMVYSAEGNYYIAAQPKKAVQSQMVMLQVVLDEQVIPVEVEVICYPRTKECEKGHRYANTPERIAEEEVTGQSVCPICQIIPETITCNVPVLFQPQGQPLSQAPIWADVMFCDGHTERIQPDCAQWHDDFDADYSGVQNVTIRYRGVETTIVVITKVPCCLQCGMDCTARYYKDYEIFPYCAECMSQKALFSGKTAQREEVVSNGEIVTCLDQAGSFKMQRGDCLMVFLKEDGNYKSVLQSRSRRNKSEESMP